ncbi:MAG: thioredoxin domain-containing protein [Parcubacteria group bacterium]|nr:thioredoxin domain-containing protein [Parcubacteria group bacterium]
MEPEQTQSAQGNQKTEQSASATDTLTKKQRRALKKLEKREQRQHAERGRTVKTWAAWIAAIAVIALGLAWLVASSNSQGSAEAPPPSEIAARDWTHGSEAAPAQIIEYSDFQCPACGAYYPIIKQLTQEFGEDLRFAYRHFPLNAIHPNAEPAARAAEAAGIQGRFWEMHDALFENQSAWSGAGNPFDLFAQYANGIGLDAAQFEADYESSAVKDAVRAHESAGRRLGVNGTPTFVLNGERIENPQSYEAFRDLLVSIVGEPELATSPDDQETATTTEEAL